MKKIFLSSSFKDVADLLYDFEKNLNKKTVTFIPTASIVEEVRFYVEEGKKSLQKLGLIVDVLDISTANFDEIKEKLTKNDYIYVTGGNTFFLLQEMKKSKAGEIIKREVDLGKLYIGESAGSMILSKNIEYVKIMDNVEKAPYLDNFEGLGLLDFYTVPHYNNFPFKKITQKILQQYSSNLNLQPISNNEAILVEDDNVKIVKL